ncbi:RING finger and transmembrane domain-containing protein 2 isoform X6 [Harpia harpyja]|uniref:RING finger and transmembrane domain-containing protein 2 isoform X6 n=1 Tax=Harpia harpyja TaxID=202280 RepID=UPI0022B1314D|nr:RING finger and transmembrane domain-containing protein 2 isoform X6 [Harpia harpyja]
MGRWTDFFISSDPKVVCSCALQSKFLQKRKKVLRKMQRRHSSNTDNVPPERNRSQTVSSETSVDESGVFESLKAEASSPQQLFSGLAGIPSGTITATPFQAGLVLGSSAGGGEVFIQMPAPREEGTSRTEGAPFHHRQSSHHFHHGHHRGSSLLHMAGGDRHGHAEEGSDEQAGTPAPALSELKAVIGWLQKGLPFILILLAKVCFQHKLGIAVCIGMASTFAYANSTLREQVALKEKRSVLVVFWILAFLTGNTLYLLYTFSSQQLYNSLIFLKPNLERLDFFDLMWIVGIADFVLKYLTIALKCLIVALPKIILAVKSKSFDICGRVGSVRKALKVLCTPQTYGVRATSQQCSEAGDICAICQAEFREPLILMCQHVFCEECLCLWFDREKTCPLCRSVTVETLRCWKDGTTSAHFQVY